MSWDEFSKVARRKFEQSQISEIEKLNETKHLQNIAMQKAKQILNDKKLRSDAVKLAEQIHLQKEKEKQDAEEKKRKEEEDRKRRDEEEKERVRKEEERIREEQEAARKKAKEEADRKERDRLVEIKRKEDEQKREKALLEAQVSLDSDFLTLFDNGSNADPLVIPDEPDETNLLKDGVKEALREVGSLIMDEDVLFALRSLKEVGKEMQKSKRSLFERDEENGQKMNLSSVQGTSSPYLGLVTIKQENNDEESAANNTFQPKSPPAKIFSGMKCHTEDSFITSGSASKRRKVFSPGHGNSTTPLTSPNRSKENPNTGAEQASSKCKTVDAGNIFIKKKKITQTGKQLVFTAVKNQGREIVEFTEEKESFYKILSFYVPSLNMTPEDMRIAQLKKELFAFIHKNYEYTQVIIIKKRFKHFPKIFTCFKIVHFSQNFVHIYFQLWATSTLNKLNKTFGYWADDQQKNGVEPDALTIVFASHWLGRNITLISGKADE